QRLVVGDRVGEDGDVHAQAHAEREVLLRAPLVLRVEAPLRDPEPGGAGLLQVGDSEAALEGGGSSGVEFGQAVERPGARRRLEEDVAELEELVAAPEGEAVIARRNREAVLQLPD